MDFMQLIQLLSGLMGDGGSSFQQPFMGSGGYSANYAQYTPGIMDSIKDFMFPGMQRQTPQHMLVTDHATAMRRSNERTAMQSHYMAYSPVLDSAVTHLGKFFGMEKQDTQQFLESSTGRILAHGWNMTMGRQIPGGGVARGEVAVGLYDSMQGVYFGKEQGMGGYGISANQAKHITSGLAGLAYKNPDLGLFQKGAFDMRQMGEIARLGGEYGLFDGAKLGAGKKGSEDVVGRVKGLADTIDLGMKVFQEFDKQNVIENIMKLTRGQVPLTSTTQIDDLLHRIAVMAKTANVSVEAMQEIGKQGADLFGSIGLGGMTGANMGMGISSRMGLVQQRVGNETPALAPDVVAGAGGRQGITSVRQHQMAQFFNSAYYRNSAAGFFLGGEDAGFKEKMMGGRTTAADVTAAIEVKAKSIAKEKGIDLDTARQIAQGMYRTDKDKYATDFLETLPGGAGGVAAAELQANATYQDALNSAHWLTKEHRGLLQDPVKNKDIAVAFLRDTWERTGVNKGMTEAQKRAAAELTIMYKDKKRVENLRTLELEDESKIIKSKYMEERRSNAGPLERVSNVFKSFGMDSSVADILRAMAPDEADISFTNISDLQKFDPKTVRSGLLWGKTKASQTAFYGYRTVMGRGSEVKGPGEAIKELGNLNRILKGHGKQSVEEAVGRLSTATKMTKDETQESFETFFRGKKFNVDSASEWLLDSGQFTTDEEVRKYLLEKGGMGNVLTLMKTTDRGKYDEFKKTLRHTMGLVNANPDMKDLKFTGEQEDILTKFFSGAERGDFSDDEFEVYKELFNTKKFMGWSAVLSKQDSRFRKIQKGLIEGAQDSRAFNRKTFKANKGKLLERVEEGSLEISDEEQAAIDAKFTKLGAKDLGDLEKKAMAAFEEEGVAGFRRVLGERAKEVMDKKQPGSSQFFKGVSIEDTEAMLRKYAGTGAEFRGSLTRADRDALKKYKNDGDTSDDPIPSMLDNIINTLVRGFSDVVEAIFGMDTEKVQSLAVRQGAKPIRAAGRKAADTAVDTVNEVAMSIRRRF